QAWRPSMQNEDQPRPRQAPPRRKRPACALGPPRWRNLLSARRRYCRLWAAQLNRGQDRMADFGGRYRVGLDIGGTFTDFVLLDRVSGEIRLHKCLTTPDDPAEGALDGLGQLLSAAGVALADPHIPSPLTTPPT